LLWCHSFGKYNSIQSHQRWVQPHLCSQHWGLPRGSDHVFCLYGLHHLELCIRGRGPWPAHVCNQSLHSLETQWKPFTYNSTGWCPLGGGGVVLQTEEPSPGDAGLRRPELPFFLLHSPWPLISLTPQSLGPSG
jgi:hypothetical protein